MVKSFKVTMIAEDYVWVYARNANEALEQARAFYGIADMGGASIDYEVVGDADGE